jgi:hypothetical protein
MPDWDNIVVAVTAFAAVVALVISVLQMRQSNKQHLFDRRLASWERVNGLLGLFAANRQQLLDEEDGQPDFAVDLEFKWLTNNTFLEQIQTAITKPLDPQEQRKLHLKLDEIKQTAIEFGFLFKGKQFTTIPHFVSLYRDLLFEMYQYKILTDHMGEYAQKFNWTLEKAQDTLDERVQYGKLEDTVRQMDDCRVLMQKNNLLKKISDKIKL